jgi:two-component system NtrC family sensor kinase
MRRRTIRFKIALYLGLALGGAMLLFVLLVAWHERGAAQDAVASRVVQLAEVITRSTRFAMLENQPGYVSTIIQDVARDSDIERIRIVGRDGRIVYSTFIPELGQVVDRNAEGCALCHQMEKPPVQVPLNNRTWTFATPGGQRLLATMAVIRNEDSCSSADCHHHSKDPAVLGVVNILYAMDDADARLRAGAFRIASISLGFVVLAAVAVSLFVHRLVYRPLRDLAAGARRVASGDLAHSIPVRAEDEFGALAGTFNGMTAALRATEDELRESAHALECKVEERTAELRRAQAEAVRGEKLASVGLLASGVAHELNNPLTGVLTFSSLLRQAMPDGSQEAEDLDVVIRETKRCASIIRRLLDFARDKPPEKTYADLNAIVEETVRIVENPAHLHDIAIVQELDPALPAVWADPNQIKQVVMNLVVNAQHAIDEKGRIVIRTRCIVPAGSGDTPMVELSIADTGCGIPPENLKRIFDPFFTTKSGKGTGLGLSVSHGIVEAHGGAIAVESEPGRGSTFRVVLPLVRPADAAQAERAGAAA